MKKSFAIFGILLMIGGLACLSLLNFKIDSKTEYVEAPENSWTIPSWSFSKGDIMSIAIWPGANNSWAPPSIGGEAKTLPPGSNQTFSGDKLKTFQIWITNPTGNWTVIEVYYITANPLQGPLPFSEYFGVENHGALILDGGYPIPGEYKGKATVVLGRVPQEGLYNVTCSIDPPMVMDQEIIGTNPNGTLITKPWLHRVSPPSLMWLFRTTEETPSPYLLVPIGAPIFVSGGIITVLWGVQRRKKPHHKIAEYKNPLHPNSLLHRPESFKPFRKSDTCI